MKKIKLILTLSLFLTSVYAYEKGKIDMHGGKGDSLLGNKGFSDTFQSLGAVKTKKEAEKENEKFIKIDKIEKIKQSKDKNE